MLKINFQWRFIPDVKNFYLLFFRNVDDFSPSHKGLNIWEFYMTFAGKGHVKLSQIFLGKCTGNPWEIIEKILHGICRQMPCKTLKSYNMGLGEKSRYKKIYTFPRFCQGREATQKCRKSVILMYTIIFAFNAEQHLNQK